MAWFRLALVWVVILLAFAIGVVLYPITLVAKVSGALSDRIADAGLRIGTWCERMLERTYD